MMTVRTSKYRIGMVKLFQDASAKTVPKGPLSALELRTRLFETAMLRASAISQIARVPMMEGISSTTTTKTLARPMAAPTSSVKITTTKTDRCVLPSNHAQTTLVSEMFPPTDASMAPETSGMRTASAARPASV